MRLSHDDCSISVPFYGHCTGIVRRLCDSRAGALRSSQEPTVIVRLFCSKTTSKNLALFARSPCDHRAMPYGDRAMLLRRVFGLRFYDLNFLYNSELNKIVEATTTLRRPKNVRYRTISVRRSYKNGNLGIVRSP